MKLNILSYALNPRLNLQTISFSLIPKSSTAGQCLLISTQLAESGKESFVLTIHEMLKQYTTNLVNDLPAMITVNGDVQKTKKSLSKIIEKITTDLKNHQSEMIKCNKKLNFYCTFKTDATPSNSLELITNQKHRRAVAKLRAGNHNLKIETGRHSTPKVPEYMRTCQCCNSNQIENEFHFLLMCNCCNAIRKIFMDDITSKYPSFVSLDDHYKIIFLFNSIDPFICRKLGYFIYEAFELRNKSTNLQITKPST